MMSEVNIGYLVRLVRLGDINKYSPSYISICSAEFRW